MTITNFDKLKRMQQQQARTSQNLPKLPSDFASKTNNKLLSSHYRDPQRLRAEPQAGTDDHQEAELTRRTSAMVKATRQPAGPQVTATVAQNGSGSQSTASSKQSQRRQEPAATSQQRQQTTAEGQQQQQQQQEVWTSTEDLFWDHMREVQNKWNTLKLNDDIWAKLIYFEQNRRLAKAYVSTPVLTIDGSTNGLDGFRIGLSGIENSYRNLDSISCLRSIGHGVKLKIDHQGNILIRKLAPMASTQSAGGQSCSIWVKEWPSSGSSSASSRRHGSNSAHNGSGSSSSGASDYSHLSSASDHENWPMREIADCDTSYKLFDMQRFKFQLERSRSEASSGALGSGSTPIDWRQCVSIISFVRTRTVATRPNGQTSTRSSQQKQVLADPCWLMLINIIAIDMLKSSVCDARPSPVAQTSALVNKVTNSNSAQATHQSPRTSKTAKKLSISGQVGDGQQQQQLETGDYAARRLVDPHAARAAMQLPSRSYQTNHTQPNSSERLERLNKNTHLQAAQPKQPSLSAAKQQPAGGPMSMMTDDQRQRHCRSSQQLDGSIYTTFTGKYLDKQQRLRAAQEQQQHHDHLPSSIDDLSLQRFHHASRVGLAPTDRCRNPHLLCPVESLRPTPSMQRLGSQLVQSGRSSNEKQSLLHSLSAFDLSHGLKLNLRSINSTSIKMNFDSDEEEEYEISEENLAQDEEPEEDLHEQRDDLIKKLNLDGLSKKSLSKLADRHQKNSSSQWASLANKYAPNESFSSSSSKSHDEEEAAPSSGIKSLESSQDSTELSSKLHPPTSERQQLDVAAKEQQKSRSSIASALSTSSGCADNDYFVSQSSNSSMSSASTRGSHEAEELSSQPASSSGIVCSGNTSDETTNHNNQGQKAPGVANARAKKCSVNNVAGQHQVNATLKRQQMNKKQSISLNRCYNVKTVDFSQEQVQDVTNCGHCLQPSTQAPQQLLPIQCDCGALEDSTCDQMLGLDQRHSSDPHNHMAASACDCCCDCLVYPSGGAPFAGSCEDGLCDCGAFDHRSNHHGGDESFALGEEEEEPIYDQLPRFGRQSTQSNQLAKLPQIKTSNRTKTRTSRRTSEERFDVTHEEDYERIVPVPMPSDGDLHKLDKSKKARFGSKELKRNSGWLESRKYIKLFPRFMFASSSSTSSSSGRHDNKSGTLDSPQQAAENKFRRSRSSQNLSKYLQ